MRDFNDPKLMKRMTSKCKKCEKIRVIQAMFLQENEYEAAGEKEMEPKT